MNLAALPAPTPALPAPPASTAPAAPGAPQAPAAGTQPGAAPAFARLLQAAGDGQGAAREAPDRPGPRPARGARGAAANDRAAPAEPAAPLAARKPAASELPSDPTATADEGPTAERPVTTPVADAAALLAGLMLPPARHAAAARPEARTEGRADTPKAGPARGGPAVEPAANAGAPKTEPSLPVPAAEAPRPAEAPAAQALPSFQAQLAALPPPAADAPRTGADPRIAESVHAPGFPAALGAEVSLLVKEGVHEARLQLNPAEMGPITVQIQLDGQNAQVLMSAEHALTRERLEQALPALAGALQDSGLTLTGGGVFQQPRQPQEPPAAAGGSGTGGAPAAEETAPTAPRRGVSHGGVDLYA